MRNNGILAVDNACIIAALVEHAHIQTENVRVVDGALHAALIGADDQHMLIIDLKVIDAAQKTFDELISRLYGVKTVERDRVHDAGIMRVEGDDIVDAHADQLLQRDRAVKRFACGALVLAALIEIGHDHGDPAGFTADRSDRSLEVLIVVVRRHVVLKTEHLIGLAVVDDICDQVQVHTADGLCHYAFSFTCAEAGKVAVDNVGRTLVADIGQRILVLALALISPACKVKVDLRSHFLASFDRNYSKGTCGHCIQMSLIMQFDRFHEFVFLAFWLKVFYELNTVCEDGCVQLVDTAALLCLRLRTRMSLPVSLYSS